MRYPDQEEPSDSFHYLYEECCDGSEEQSSSIPSEYYPDEVYSPNVQKTQKLLPPPSSSFYPDEQGKSFVSDFRSETKAARTLHCGKCKKTQTVEEYISQCCSSCDTQVEELPPDTYLSQEMLQWLRLYKQRLKSFRQSTTEDSHEVLNGTKEKPASVKLIPNYFPEPPGFRYFPPKKALLEPMILPLLNWEVARAIWQSRLKQFFSENPIVRDAIFWYWGGHIFHPPSKRVKEEWHLKSDPHLTSRFATELIEYAATIERIYVKSGIIKKDHAPIGLPEPGGYVPRLPIGRLSDDDGKPIVENARKMYFAYVANSIVIEYHGLLYWRLGDYPKEGIAYLFSSKRFYLYDYRYRNIPELGLKGWGHESGFFNGNCAIVPSDPTEIFLWMYRKGWISLLYNRMTKFPAQRLQIRAQTRDAFFEWWRDRFKHTSASASPSTINAEAYGKILRRNDSQKTPYTSANYFSNYYWGVIGAVPLKRVIEGFKHSENSPGRVIKSRKKKSKGDWTVHPAKEEVYFFDGCHFGANVVSYALKTINIPAYYAKLTSGGGHGSFILPTEPEGSSHAELQWSTWILPHFDDLTGRNVTGADPNNPAPIKDLFFTWKNYEQKFISTPVMRHLAPTLPSPTSKVRLFDTENIPSRYSLSETFYHQIREQHYKAILKNYPNLPLIVYAMYHVGWLSKYVPSMGHWRNPHYTFKKLGKEIDYYPGRIKKDFSKYTDADFMTILKTAKVKKEINSIKSAWERFGIYLYNQRVTQK